MGENKHCSHKLQTLQTDLAIKVHTSLKLTSSSFIMCTQSLRMCVGAPNSLVKAINVLALNGGPATYRNK